MSPWKKLRSWLLVVSLRLYDRPYLPILLQWVGLSIPTCCLLWSQINCFLAQPQCLRAGRATLGRKTGDFVHVCVCERESEDRARGRERERGRGLRCSVTPTHTLQLEPSRRSLVAGGAFNSPETERGEVRWEMRSPRSKDPRCCVYPHRQQQQQQSCCCGSSHGSCRFI